MEKSQKLTATSNEIALQQFVALDGRRLLSVVQNGGHFRYVEEQETHQPASPAVPAYEYWEEAHRSGLYQSESDALSAAEREVPWLRTQLGK